MNDLPREQLKYLIGQYGLSLAEDPKRCEALLRDFCGQYRKEINVLVSAIKEAIPADLNSSQHRVPSDLLLAQLTKRLEDRLAIDRAAARWGVESWAIALGLTTQRDRRQVEEPVTNDLPPQNRPRTEQTNDNLPPPNRSRTEQNNDNPTPNRSAAESAATETILSVNPNIKLFSQNQVRLVTFLFGILGGSILMALNYARTDRVSKYRKYAIFGIITTIVLTLFAAAEGYLVSVFVKSSLFAEAWGLCMFLAVAGTGSPFLNNWIIPDILLLFAHAYLAGKWYERSQKTLFKQHLLSGGKEESSWVAVLIAFFYELFIFLIFCIIILILDGIKRHK